MLQHWPLIIWYGVAFHLQSLGHSYSLFDYFTQSEIRSCPSLPSLNGSCPSASRSTPATLCGVRRPQRIWASRQRRRWCARWRSCSCSRTSSPPSSPTPRWQQVSPFRSSLVVVAALLLSPFYLLLDDLFHLPGEGTARRGTRRRVLFRFLINLAVDNGISVSLFGACGIWQEMVVSWSIDFIYDQGGARNVYKVQLIDGTLYVAKILKYSVDARTFKCCSIQSYYQLHSKSYLHETDEEAESSVDRGHVVIHLHTSRGAPTLRWMRRLSHPRRHCLRPHSECLSQGP